MNKEIIAWCPFTPPAKFVTALVKISAWISSGKQIASRFTEEMKNAWRVVLTTKFWGVLRADDVRFDLCHPYIIYGTSTNMYMNGPYQGPYLQHMANYIYVHYCYYSKKYHIIVYTYKTNTIDSSQPWNVYLSVFSYHSKFLTFLVLRNTWLLTVYVSKFIVIHYPTRYIHMSYNYNKLYY